MWKCWAQSLGNCSGPLSREHIVTAGLFGDVVSVQGFSWCKDEPKIIGLPNFTRNILCATHNRALSRIDTAAIKAFDVFRECVRLVDVRQSMKERFWNIVRMEIDGSASEPLVSQNLN